MTISFRSRRLDGTWDETSLQPFTFPAGEAHIKIAEDFDPDNYNHFVADIRGHVPQDLFHLGMWQSVVDSKGFIDSDTNKDNFPEKTVILPYIPGARADRGFPRGVRVYAEFIHGLFIQNAIVLDPHSPVSFEELDSGDMDVQEFPFERIIRNEIQDKTSDSRPTVYDGVIAPDHGARERAARAAQVMGVPVYTAGKTRDFETGQLTGFHMEDELPKTGKFLIVDDICDGGGTFIGLAKAIADTNPDVALDLWVTHGVFSKGISDLLDWFGVLRTTDSFYGTRGADYMTGVHERSGERFKVYHLSPYLYGAIGK